MSAALKARADKARAWLFNDALPVWAEHGVNPRGGFFDRLDADLRPSGDLRLRVQARQTYVFAEAGRLGWSGPWRPLVEHGLAFLLHRARLDSGLVASVFDRDGGVQTASPDLYDQAFALFAFAHAYAVLGDERARAAATALRIALQPHPLGGFRELAGPGLNANPQMHLFEAVLTWAEFDDDPAWRSLAEQFVALCHGRLVDPRTATLREHLDDSGAPAPGAAGAVTEPGHHLEWAWLLDRHGPASDPLPLRLSERAERLGVDPARGVVVKVLDPDGAVLDGGARLWAQAERVKAALAMRRRAPDPWTGRAGQAIDGLFSFIDPAPRGLWFDLMEEDGTLRPQPAPASSFYHILGACSELFRETA